MKGKETELIIHCTYTENGEKLEDIIINSLKLFIDRNIINCAKI